MEDVASFLALITGYRTGDFSQKHALIACILAAGIAFLVSQAVYKFCFSPLSGIPGPKLAKVTSLQMVLSQFRYDKIYWVESLFQKYGPVVQIAPNVVATNETEGVRKIYKNTKVIKSSFYDVFGVVEGERTCLALRDTREAGRRRKSYLPSFSRHNLVSFAPRIYEHLLQLMEIFDKASEKHDPVDAFRYWRYLTFDVIVDLTFSGSFEMVKNPAVGTEFIEMVENFSKWQLLNLYMPFIDKVPNAILPKVLKEWKHGADEAVKFPKNALQAWREAKESGNLESRAIDVIHLLSKYGEENPDEKLRDGEIVAAIEELMIAGSDTTATITTCICFELAQNPEIQDKLYQELCGIIPSSTGTTFSTDMFNELERNKYLDAVCKEGLRKHASLPALLERVVPPEGMEIGGEYLPGNTIIAMQAYSQHRKEDVYPEAEDFKPERWLEETLSMKENFLAFSTGHRGCVGLSLANLQLRLYLGVVIRDYEILLHPDTTNESMRMLESYITKPKGDSCLLYFRRRQ